MASQKQSISLSDCLSSIPKEGSRLEPKDLSGKLFENKIVSQEGYLAFMIDEFLSAEECKRLVKATEARGYEAALVNVGFGRQKLMPDVRSSDRCIVDDDEFAAKLFERVKEYVPAEMKGKRLVGLNERMRFLRYDKGGYFKPHMDGCYVRQDGKEMSLVTFFLFLNEGCKGGESTFMNLKDQSKNVPCVPKAGSLVVFQHDILHEGSKLKKGRKYALRTDFMYC